MQMLTTPVVMKCRSSADDVQATVTASKKRTTPFWKFGEFGVRGARPHIRAHSNQDTLSMVKPEPRGVKLGVGGFETQAQGGGSIPFP